MTIGLSAGSFPHISNERNWEMSRSESDRLWGDYAGYTDDVGYTSDFVTDVSIMKKDALGRHAAEQEKNLTRLQLTGREKHKYDVVVGVRCRLGEFIGRQAMKSSEIFDSLPADAPFNKVTLEVAGSVWDSKTIDEAPELIEDQLADFAPRAHYDPYDTSRPEHRRIQFQPYFNRAFVPENPDFSFTKGRIRVRYPVANIDHPDWPPINLFRQREVMLSIPRTDAATREALQGLSAQGLEHEGNDEQAIVTRVFARRAYERFVAQPDAVHQDLVLIRDQILATAFMPSE